MPIEPESPRNRINAMRTSLAALSAFCAALASPALAQETNETDLLITAEGFYSVKGELGLFGVVVAWQEDIATFKPCLGPTFKIEREELEPTDFTCEDTAPSDPNSMQVSCEEHGMWSSGVAVERVEEEVERPGLAYAFDDAKQDLELVQIDAKEMVARLDTVAAFEICGDLLTGFDREGQSVLNVYTLSGGGREHLQ